MLGKLECTLATGKMMSLTEEQKEAAKASPTVALLFAAINPGKNNELDGAVKRWWPARAGAAQGVCAEGVRGQSPRAPEAAEGGERLFMEVLQANPVLAGAYKDLGDLLLMQYDSPRAWRSWDTGRRLALGFVNFEAVNKFEASMVAQHPEYF
jgi:hypothetical protein